MHAFSATVKHFLLPRLHSYTTTVSENMGIPHLITYLQPYTESKSLRDERFVIDGPGLAYHIHHLCLRLRPGARNPFEAGPAYKELGEAAIIWLDELRSRGATV